MEDTASSLDNVEHWRYVYKPKEKEDLNYYNGIKDTCFPSYQYKKIQTLIAQDIASSNILRVFHWIIKKDKLKLSNSLLVKSIIWSFVFKSSRKIETNI